MEDSIRNKYLIFSSVGVQSRHRMWLNCFDKNRDFDIALAYFGDDDVWFETETKNNSDSFNIYQKKGLKWPNFYDYILNNDISKYRYIWVPDDDIEIFGDKISEMFATMENNPNISIAIPSTSHDSVTSFGLHRKDMHRCFKTIEYLDFVECGLILLKTDMFNNPTFIKILKAAHTGYYVDNVMRFCFDLVTRHKSIAVLHNIVCCHPKRNDNTVSELDIVVPRNLHSHDKVRFLNEGFTEDMLKGSDKKYSHIKRIGLCRDCNLGYMIGVDKSDVSKFSIKNLVSRNKQKTNFMSYSLGVKNNSIENKENNKKTSEKTQPIRTPPIKRTQPKRTPPIKRTPRLLKNADEFVKQLPPVPVEDSHKIPVHIDSRGIYRPKGLLR